MSDINTCVKCKRDFKYISNLKRHQNRKTSCIIPKSYNCLTCDRVYRHQSSLCKHKKVCNGVNKKKNNNKHIIKKVSKHLEKTIKVLKQSEIVLFDSDDDTNSVDENNYNLLECVYCNVAFKQRDDLKYHIENNCEKVTEITVQLLKDIKNIETKIKRILDINSHIVNKNMNVK